MDTLVELLLLAVCVAASFLYSGSETGLYSLSRIRVDLEADHGRRTAAIVRRLLRDEPALLITILIGNNLANQLATHFGDELAAGLDLSPAAQALLVALVLSPVLFLLGEGLPKELFRRRPHGLTYPAAPFVLASRLAYWPLERLLRGLSLVLERGFGLSRGDSAVLGGRDRLAALFAEGRRQGALSARAETLARNALQLRSIPLSHAMVPWSKVGVLERERAPEGHFARVRDSRWTRLPVVGPGGAFEGYVHQLEVLAAGPDRPVLTHLRSMPVLAPDTPVDRALLTLRGGGHRAAVVGTAQDPVGLVTLKDLVEEISGDLVGL